MKRIFCMGLAIFVLSFLFMPNNSVQAGNPYDYEVVDISPGANLNHGESVILWVKIKNTGTVEWRGNHSDQVGKDYVHLGTRQPEDRISDFYKESNWLSHNRVHMMDEYTVAPGETGSFGFYVQVPDYLPAGTYHECFAPVVEGVTWMADKGICWDIEVSGEVAEETYAAELVGEDVSLGYLTYGTEREVELRVKNVGTAMWYRDGANPMHLGTVNSLDHEGYLYHESWLSKNRLAQMEEEVVRPGEVATFRFWIRVPELRAKEDVWLVAEGKTWLDGANSSYAPKYATISTHGIPFDDENSYIEVDEVNPLVGDEVIVTVGLFDSDDNPIVGREVTLFGGGCYTEGVGCAYIEEVVVTDENGLASYANSFVEPAELSIWYKVDDWYSIDVAKIEYGREGQWEWQGDYVKAVYHDRQDGWERSGNEAMFDELKNQTLIEIADIYTGYGQIYQLDRDMLNIKSQYDWYELNLADAITINYNVFDGLGYVDKSAEVNKILVIIRGDTGDVYFSLSDNQYDYMEYISLDSFELDEIGPILEEMFE